MANLRVTAAGAYAEQSGEGLRVSAAGAYVEQSGEGLRVTIAGAYVELGSERFYVTAVGAYVEGLVPFPVVPDVTARPFGLRDVKLVALDGGSYANLPAARVMALSERYRAVEILGDEATVLAVISILDGLNWELEAGGIDLDAWAILTGRTVATAGTSPGRTATYTASGAEYMPWIRIYGKALSDDCVSDIHAKLWKAKVLALEGGFQDGQFFVSHARGVAVDDGVNGLLDLVQEETAAELPTT